MIDLLLFYHFIILSFYQFLLIYPSIFPQFFFSSIFLSFHLTWAIRRQPSLFHGWWCSRWFGSVRGRGCWSWSRWRLTWSFLRLVLGFLLLLDQRTARRWSWGFFRWVLCLDVLLGSLEVLLCAGPLVPGAVHVPPLQDLQFLEYGFYHFSFYHFYHFFFLALD